MVGGNFERYREYSPDESRRGRAIRIWRVFRMFRSNRGVRESLRVAIETATKKQQGEKWERRKGRQCLPRLIKIVIIVTTRQRRTSTTKNVFSCFSHLPKDLEIAKRKCTGAITAELCSRARVESNVVDDEIDTIVKKGIDDRIKDNEGNFEKGEYDRVSGIHLTGASWLVEIEHGHANS